MVVSPEDIEQEISRPVSMTGFSVRGALRMSQTLLKVYPRALQWGLGRRRPEPRELRELFESLGATYIKFGQLIASTPSVFPREFVDEFQLLLDKTPSIPFGKIKVIIESELGRPLEEVYASIEPEPLASASIAQVHAARLLSGEDVVVKVQKPGVEEIINVDMNAAYLCARLMEMIVPNMSKDVIAGLVSELYQAMIDECDFKKEAENIKEFRRYLSAVNIDDVIAPKPYLLASGLRVLTMERIYGSPLTDLANIRNTAKEPADILTAAMNAWFGSLTQCESFHADLHNGNMMVQDDGKVVFIDFGMVGRIKAEAWQAVFSLLSGLTDQNYRQVAESMLAIGMTSNEINIDRLTADIEQLFNNVYDIDPLNAMSSSQGASEIDNAMSNLGEISKRYGIRFPRAFTLLLKQFLYFDRYVEALAPGMDVFDSAQMSTVEL